jgi:tetratricopeptide (TPR) repeat protein
MFSKTIRPAIISCLFIFLCIDYSFSQSENEFYNLSKKSFDNGLYNDALFTLNKGMKRDSSKADYFLLRAKIYFKLNKYDAAISDCYAALNREPDKPEVFFLRGQLCQVTKSYGGAILFFGKVIKFSKNEDLTFNSYLNRGNSYFEMGKYNDAYNDYIAAQALHPEDLELLYSLANTYFKLLKVSEAKSTIEKILVIDPDYALAYELRGKIAYGNKKFEEAIRDIETYTKLNATDPQGFILLAESYLNLNEYDKALFNINSSINIQPANAYGYKIKGLIYIQQKQIDEGCNNLFKALQMGYLENVSYDILDIYLKNCEAE